MHWCARRIHALVRQRICALVQCVPVLEFAVVTNSRNGPLSNGWDSRPSMRRAHPIR
jgi:hypothetical protein